MEIPEFDSEEFGFLSNADLLIKKRIIQEKIFKLLEITLGSIRSGINAPIAKLFPEGKISRGENYQALPYLILDYPAIFSMNDILACRTMFLWGNFFSTTIHLQGSYLKRNHENIVSTITGLEQNELFISVGETPWHYHYEPSNYLPLNSVTLDKAINRSFVKISRRIALDDHYRLPALARDFYQRFLDNLKLKA